MTDHPDHYCSWCGMWGGNVLSIVKDHESRCDMNPEAK